jgi:hypothetical protein
MVERVGRGSLTGRWEPRAGACPKHPRRDYARTGSAGENQALANGVDQGDRWRRIRFAHGGDRRRRREVQPMIRSPARAAERMRRGRPVYG